MNNELRRITDEINRRPEEIEEIEGVAEWFDAHMEACAEADRLLAARTESELVQIIEDQGERPDSPRCRPQGTLAAKTAAGNLSLRYYFRAQKMTTAEILDELAPLTDYRDGDAALYRPEDYREDITIPDALRRESLVGVLTGRYDVALDVAVDQPESKPRRDQVADICQAVERHVKF